MKISMIGLGYIGLPTASIIANKHSETVYGFDINENYVKSIRDGSCSPEEPGLNAMLKEVINEGKLKVSTSIVESDVYIIAVPTPFNLDKTCDCRYIEAAVISVCTVLKPGDLIILESTVSPGTTEHVVKRIIEKRTRFRVSDDVFVAYSAERVIPGNIIHELVHNARIIGGIDSISAKKAEEVYRIFVDGEIYLTDCVTAEVTKIMENTYRDINIAIANEFASLGESLGFNVWEAIQLANKHPRVNILQPGPGVGGHCIAIDPWFFVGLDDKNTRMIKTAREVNDSMPEFVVEKLLKAWPDVKTVGVLGVTYKANVGDTRTSPSSLLVNRLAHRGINVLCHDPFAVDYTFDLYPLDTLIEESDALVVMVDHEYYRSNQVMKMLCRVQGIRILDTRNIYAPGEPGTGAVVLKLGIR